MPALAGFALTAGAALLRAIRSHSGNKGDREKTGFTPEEAKHIAAGLFTLGYRTVAERKQRKIEEEARRKAAEEGGEQREEPDEHKSAKRKATPDYPTSLGSAQFMAGTYPGEKPEHPHSEINPPDHHGMPPVKPWVEIAKNVAFSVAVHSLSGGRGYGYPLGGEVEESKRGGYRRPLIPVWGSLGYVLSLVGIPMIGQMMYLVSEGIGGAALWVVIFLLVPPGIYLLRIFAESVGPPRQSRDMVVGGVMC